ncbi:hypothetical protein ES703_76826 [subsurface metagenome]
MKRKLGWRWRPRSAYWRFVGGMRFAFGIGGFWHNTTCPACERDIEIEIQ